MDNFLSSAKWCFEEKYDILRDMQRLTKHKKIKGIRKHGFLARMKTHGGQKTIKRRRDQGRKELAISL